ncbi:hypothetical protein, partial [Mesorhizobium sp. B2-9-1]|uniref:hypothetical protein n=1 Tax=Mesorhizobium sp. B2-9-1 TaxID=2589898 RepID=UPI001AEF04A7
RRRARRGTARRLQAPDRKPDGHAGVRREKAVRKFFTSLFALIIFNPDGELFALLRGRRSQPAFGKGGATA